MNNYVSWRFDRWIVKEQTTDSLVCPLLTKKFFKKFAANALKAASRSRMLRYELFFTHFLHLAHFYLERNEITLGNKSDPDYYL